MAKKMHDTPMLDQLESGPWPSFVTGLKRLAKDKDYMVDLMGQLETSYRTKKGYWKGGTVGVEDLGRQLLRGKALGLGDAVHTSERSLVGNQDDQSPVAARATTPTWPSPARWCSPTTSTDCWPSSRASRPSTRWGDATTWSPAPAMLRIAKVSAAWPEASNSAATPPSRAAMRCSTVSWVGFMIRV